MQTHTTNTPTGAEHLAARTTDVTNLDSVPASEAPVSAAAEDVEAASECAAATFARRFSFF